MDKYLINVANGGWLVHSIPMLFDIPVVLPVDQYADSHYLILERMPPTPQYPDLPVCPWVEALWTPDGRLFGVVAQYREANHPDPGATPSAGRTTRRAFIFDPQGLRWDADIRPDGTAAAWSRSAQGRPIWFGPRTEKPRGFRYPRPAEHRLRHAPAYDPQHPPTHIPPVTKALLCLPFTPDTTPTPNSPGARPRNPADDPTTPTPKHFNRYHTSLPLPRHLALNPYKDPAANARYRQTLPPHLVKRWNVLPDEMDGKAPVSAENLLAIAMECDKPGPSTIPTINTNIKMAVFAPTVTRLPSWNHKTPDGHTPTHGRMYLEELPPTKAEYPFRQGVFIAGECIGVIAHLDRTNEPHQPNRIRVWDARGCVWHGKIWRNQHKEVVDIKLQRPSDTSYHRPVWLLDPRFIPAADRITGFYRLSKPKSLTLKTQRPPDVLKTTPADA